MKKNRFKNFSSEVKELVLDFETMSRSGVTHYYDQEQMEIIIDYYLETYDMDMLSHAVEYAERLFPDSSEIRLRRAHMLCAKERFEDALEILHAMEHDDAGNTDVMYALGTVYSAMERPRKAIQYYLRASRDGVDLDMVYGNIGDEYKRQGNFLDAIYYYRQALKKNPREERSVLNLARCFADEPDQAVIFFSAFVKENPYSAEGWLSLGSAYMDCDLYERAEDALLYALAIDKSYHQVYQALSSCYLKSGEWQKCVNILHDSIPYTDDIANTYCIMAECFENQQNYTTAILYYQKALQDDPYYAEAYTWIAECYRAIGEYNDAVANMQKAIEINPDKGEYRMLLSRLHMEFGHEEEGLKIFNETIQRNDRLEDHWIPAAKNLMDVGEWKPAAQLLQEGMMLCPNHTLFIQNLAICYFFLHRREEMMNYLTTLSTLDPDALAMIFVRYPEMRLDVDIAAMLRNMKQE